MVGSAAKVDGSIPWNPMMTATAWNSNKILNKVILTRWQHDAKYTAFAQLALRFDAAALVFDGPLGDCQAQTVSPFGAGTGLVDAVKAVEDSLSMLRSDARPFVGDFDDRGAIAPAAPDRDPTLAGRVANRVVDDVQHRLAQQPAVGGLHHVRVANQFDGLLLFGREHAQAVAHFVEEFRHADGFRLEAYLAAFHARQRQQRLDQVIEPLGFFEHAPDGFAQHGDRKSTRLNSS